MKHIKLIREFTDTDLDTVGQIHDNHPKGKSEYSPEDMRRDLDAALALPNFEDTTITIRDIRIKYPFVKTDEPYASIWNEYLNRWHEEKYTGQEPNSKSAPSLAGSKEYDNWKVKAGKTFPYHEYSLDQMRKDLDAAMALPDFESTTQAIRDIRIKYPFVKTEQPYADVWQEYLNRWHEEKYGPAGQPETDEPYASIWQEYLKKYGPAGQPENNFPPSYKNGGDEPYEGKRYRR